MGELLVILGSWVSTTALVTLLLRIDEKQLSESELSRAWPVASKAIAIVYFGVLAVPVHFWRTRRGIRGMALGIAWAVVVQIIVTLLTLGIDALCTDVR